MPRQTTKTAKTTKASKAVKTVTSLEDLQQIVEKTEAPASPVVNKPVKQAKNVLPPGVHYVTSLNLKRKNVEDAVRAPFFVSNDDYRYLNTLGIQCGVTWCEVLRGLIAQHQISGDQTSGLKHFIPALN